MRGFFGKIVVFGGTKFAENSNMVAENSNIVAENSNIFACICAKCVLQLLKKQKNDTKRRKIMKTTMKILCSVLLAAALAVTASAAFAKKNTYGGQFTDVKETSWYAKDVASAYELGFVEGVSETQYSPDTTVTVAQGITMASRVHAEYNGKTIPEVSGGKWYDMYVNYAKENGIITENQFDSYTREIKRFEMAEIFHDAMGSAYFNAINDVVFIPDVPMGAMYYDKLLTLYNAGVVMGSDDYGSYKPEDNIKRSECAAIIGRVALPENRLQKELKDFTSEEAYVLCYNVGMSNSRDTLGINSGWVLDNRGGNPKTTDDAYNSLGDVSEEYATAYVREFNFIPSGEIVLETQLISKNEGTFVEYRDIEENTVYMLKVVDGKWSVLGKDGKYTAVADAVDGNTNIRAYVNLDTGKSKTFVNGKGGVEADLLSDNVLSYRAGIDEKGTGSLVVTEVNMVVNYGLYENFNLFGADSVYGWQASGAVYDDKTKQVDLSSGSIEKSFEAIDGTVVAEAYLNSVSGADFAVAVGNVLTVEAKGGKLVADGKELYSLTKNMWYRLRVEADTTAGTAKVWLNGRVVGEVNLASKEAVSSLKVTGTVSIDNVQVYEKFAHDDYVPAPAVKANLDDYLTVMNICSLWRNGTHFGWGVVSAYDEPTPLLGFYDEGNPESADWEIKWMVEHGIDVQAFCWYADTSTAPLKFPNNSQQLHHGYMYSEYSDYMYYVIIWEAAGTNKLTSQQFRTNTVPYWFENYFLDDRYLKIDNKIVLPIYSASTLYAGNNLGSVEAVKAEFDYLEEVAKSYGFDGVILLSSGSGSPSAQLSGMGFDGLCAYNWGTKGKDFDENVKRNTSSAAEAEKHGMYFVPTASVGFDSIPWLAKREGMMTVEDYKKTTEWIRDTYLPKYSKNASWADKLVWLSTWNEYGEGTYMMPAGQNGFGYVDVVREVFTDLPDTHTDVVPTLVQRERINHLYPQYAKYLARDGEYFYTKTTSISSKDAPKNKLYVNGIDILANCDAEKSIPAQIIDGKVYFPFNPMTCVHYVLDAHYEYRKDAGTLRILANDHEVIFEIGSDRYVLDGKETDLGYTLTTFDSLPMLDFEKLAKDLGYKSEAKDGDLYIYTDTYESSWKSLTERKTGGWEFNGFDTEGWSSSNMNLVMTGSSMNFVTNDKNTGDPIAMFSSSAFPEDFHTKRYISMEMKFRYNITNATTEPHIKFYYITDVDSTYSEKKTILIGLSDLSSNGEWVTAKVDLAGLEPWQAATALTGLRFDPFNGYGEMEVDYIRFIEDPNYVYVPIEEIPMSITNGDAESDSLNPFRSNNAKVERVEDPDKKGNHVWHVNANPGAQYVYFRYDARYTEGKTYKVSFDIKLGENNTGADITSSSFCLNLVYADKGALNDKDHIAGGGNRRISQADGWIHYEVNHTIDKLDSKTGSEFAIYMNPVGDTGFSYYLDNITIEMLSEEDQMKANPSRFFKWEGAKGEVIFDTDEQWETLTKFSGLTEHKVENGELYMVADESADPQVYINGSFDGDKYKLVAVRFKMENVGKERTTAGFKIYFETKAEPGLAESKSTSIKTVALIDNGDGYYTAALHMLNDAWKGEVTTIRIDPLDATGTFILDKVMLVDIN